MILKGRTHLLGDDVNTDLIISSKYRGMPNREMASHLLEDLNPNIVKSIREGDFLVAGKNFGCGSSRESAPMVIKEAGIKAVVAISYARIFYRNSANLGLWLLEGDTRGIEQGDEVSLDLEKWVMVNAHRNRVTPLNPIPAFMLQILQDGGLVPHFKKWGGFKDVG